LPRDGVHALLSSIALIATGAAAPTPSPTPAKESTAKPGLPPPPAVHKNWTGDFDGMVKRRVIRALVPYSKTFYFVDRATQRGLSYEVTQLLEADINKKLKTGNVRIHVVCIPVTRGEMIPALLEGRGDIAMGNLTITPERLKQVDFTDPTQRNVVEIVVAGPSAEPIATAADLSGKEVYLRKSSSYYQSIQTLNAELAKAKKAPVKVRLAPENLEDEDVLEMVNAGLVKMTIVEDYLANFWKQIFTNLTPLPNVTIRNEGEVAWMIRKDSPKLKEELNAFVAASRSRGSAPTSWRGT
jgi:ABC-type amino acid transport substrate-binding protein